MEQSFCSLHYIYWLLLLHSRNSVTHHSIYCWPLLPYLSSWYLMLALIALSRLSLPYYGSHCLFRLLLCRPVWLSPHLSYYYLWTTIIGDLCQQILWLQSLDLIIEFHFLLPFCIKDSTFPLPPFISEHSFRYWLISWNLVIQLPVHIVDFGILIGLSYGLILFNRCLCYNYIALCSSLSREGNKKLVAPIPLIY